MTEPDVRTAAQAEADSRYVGNPDDHSLSPAFAELRRQGFTEGAVWGAALVTPTREQIAEAVAEAQNVPFVGRKQERIVDAVLALMSSHCVGEVRASGGLAE